MVECVAKTVPDAMLQDTSRALRLATLASTGKQTVRHAQMVPEFHHVEQWHAPAKPSVPCKMLTDASTVGEKTASYEHSAVCVDSHRDSHQPTGCHGGSGVGLDENLSRRDCHQPPGCQGGPGIGLENGQRHHGPAGSQNGDCDLEVGKQVAYCQRCHAAEHPVVPDPWIQVQPELHSGALPRSLLR